MEAPGVILGEPLIEPVVPYQGVDSIRDVCAEMGLSAELADVLGHMIFDSDGTFTLHHHQANSMRVSLAGRRRTSEMLWSLPAPGLERRSAFCCQSLRDYWRSSSQQHRSLSCYKWWDRGERGRWQPAREDPERAPALRAVILYPTNALVEDQVGRLRRAISRAPRRGGGPPLFFGRYTGATEGSGADPGTDVR